MINWKEYESRRASVIEAELKACIESKEFDKFNEIYQARGMRYLTKKRRQPLYLMVLAARSEQIRRES